LYFTPLDKGEAIEIIKVYYHSPDRTFTLNLSQHLPQYVQALQRFLDRLQAKVPQTYPAYLSALESYFKQLVSKSPVNLQTIAVPGIQQPIAAYTDLEKYYFSYAYRLLDIPADYAEESIELLMYSSDRSILYPRYQRALVLCQVMGRARALEYLGEFTAEIRTQQVRDNPDLQFDDLDQFWQDDQNAAQVPPNSNYLSARLQKGKLASRSDVCMAAEVMKPFEDRELADILFCSGDKALIESRNPNFVFTRTKTLMRGHDYCDFCLHDKRYITSIQHPDEAFWTSLDDYLEA
jgi:hypothetical protein